MARRSPHARRWLALIAGLVLVASLGAPIVTASPASGLPLSFNLTTFRDLAVDPASGRVFLSGDDAVLVFDRDGVALTTIPNLPGAGGLAVDGGSLWVGETGTDRIAEVDLATLTMTRELVPNWPVRGASLERIGGALWFVGAGQLVRFDLTTGVRSARGPAGPELVPVPAVPGVVISYDPADAAGRITKLDTTTSPATVVQTLSVGAPVTEVVADPTRPVVLYVSSGLVVATEVSVTTMTPTGVRLPAGNRLSAAATSATGAVVLASRFPGSVVLAAVAAPGRFNTVPLTTNVLTRGLAVAGDGTRAYAVADLQGQDPWIRYLHVIDLRPTIRSTIPGAVVAGQPAVLAVTGSNLAVASAVTVGGIAATFAATGTGLAVDVPRTVPAGTQSLVVTTPAGTATSDLVVQASTGATLTGTVRREGVIAPGMSLTLTGSSVGAPRTTVSAADGTFAFAGLGTGADAALVTHDPSGGGPDQRTTGMVLVPNTATTVDVHLPSTTAGTGAELARTHVPIGTIGDLAVDTATNRVFVSAGDEVAVFDRDGRSIGRVVGLRGAVGLAIIGRDLWVNATADQRLVRVDLATQIVTGSWPISVTNGELVPAGGRLWFSQTFGAPSYQTLLASFDPATGSVRTAVRTARHLSPVDGSPDLLYVSAYDTLDRSKTRGWVLSTASKEPTVVATALAPESGAGSVALDLLWTSLGTYRLSDLQPAARSYPNGAGATYPAPVAVSGARGGLVAIGSTVSHQGTAVGTHSFPFAPSSSGFDADADRLFLAVGTTLVVEDLHPHLTGVQPAMSAGPIYPEATSLYVAGTGLLSTTAVVIDGIPAPVLRTTAESVEVAVSGLAFGSHTLSVTTEWGPSSTSTFTVVGRPPSISSATPSVSTAGGTVFVRGEHLTGASVLLGTDVVDAMVIDDATLTFRAGPHAPATVDLAVRTSRGTSPAVPFSWTPVAPTVASVSPSHGPNGGGTLVLIRGTSFGVATRVAFGGNAAPTVIVVDDATIFAVAPPGPDGPATIRVTNPAGTNASGPEFTYDAGVRFSDVPPGAPFYADIDWAAGAAITNGYADGTFRPLASIDRQAMAAFLYRFAGAPLGAHPACAAPPFTDVPVSSPFCGEIAWLKAQAITTGNPDGTFRPSATVDRRSMAAFLYRVIGAPNGAHPTCTSAPFTDVPVSSPFCGEIAWMKANGIAGGYADGSFQPGEAVNRQATAAFLHRLGVR